LQTPECACLLKAMVRTLETAPGFGPLRLVPIVVTPHRFGTKRQFWRSPDAVIQFGDPAESVLLRSERTGLGGAQEDGRVYVVSFTADSGGDSCTGAVTVGVPHDRKDTSVDDGQLFDSTLR
ncbi:MAG: hypothetical protein ABGY42_01675, partial [bacterium]